MTFLFVVLLSSAMLTAQSGSDRIQPGTPAASAAAVSQTTGLPVGETTAADRGQWFLKSSVGPMSLLGAGVMSAAWSTLLDSPEEYGRTWRGFGQRYGMRLTGVIPGNAIEAGLGAVWGEDPRYYQSPQRGFGGRVGHVLKMSVMARRSDGSLMPAYARYTATVGNNLLSNAWREKSENDLNSALLRSVYGILGRMGSNAFLEFWPDVKKKVLPGRKPQP